MAWSFAFFWMHSPAAGFAVILLLIVAIVVTIVLFDRSSRPAALLLVPYLLWVSFAAALNFAFWLLNARHEPNAPSSSPAAPQGSGSPRRGR